MGSEQGSDAVSCVITKEAVWGEMGCAVGVGDGGRPGTA